MFTPAQPTLYTLNATAWLAFELCDGRPRASAAASYCEAVGRSPDDQQAGAEFDRIVADLHVKGIVTFVPSSTAENPA